MPYISWQELSDVQHAIKYQRSMIRDIICNLKKHDHYLKKAGIIVDGIIHLGDVKEVKDGSTSNNGR